MCPQRTIFHHLLLSFSELSLSQWRTKSRLIRFHFVVIFVFPPSMTLFFSFVLPTVLTANPGTIYHVAISAELPPSHPFFPFLAGKPLEHLCITAARLHSGPSSRHLSSFVLTFYLPLPCVKPYLQCPL